MKTFKVGDIVTIKEEWTSDIKVPVLEFMIEQCGGRRYRITKVDSDDFYMLNDPSGYTWDVTAFKEYSEESTLNIKVLSKYNKITFNFNL